METESDKSKIEQLKKKLYTNSVPDNVFDESSKKVFVPNNPSTNYQNTSNEWQPPFVEDSFPKNHAPAGVNKFVKMFFIISLVFCALAATVAAIIFFGNFNRISADNIDITIVGPVSIAGGEPLSLGVTIDNRNRVDLKNIRLRIDYPQGAYAADDTSLALPRDEKTFDTIVSGGQQQTTFNSVLFGQENSTETFTVTIEYNVPGSNNLYTKQKTYDILLTKAPISLLLDYDKTVNNGQNVTFTIDAVSNSSAPLKGVLMKAVYPSGFTFTSADADSVTNTNDTWLLGDFAPGDKKTLTINGTIQGQENDQKVFRFSLGSASADDPHSIGTIFVQNLATMALVKPFLGIDFNLGDATVSGDIISSLGTYSNANLAITNNMPAAVTNVKIEVTPQGQFIDPYSVKPNSGYYQSSGNVVYWNKVSDTDLASIDPGQSVQTTFSFATLPLNKLPQLVRNPQMPVQITVTGDTVTQDGVRPVSVTLNKNIKFSTDVAFNASVAYSKGPLKNNGPVPPRADQPTTYTLLFTLKNTSNQVSNSALTFKLPINVDYVTSGSGSENVSFDPSTHILTWAVGELVPYTGYTTAVRTAAIQVTVSPSTSQVGNNAPLATGISFSGVDRFTGNMIQLTAQDLTTDLNTSEGISGIVGQ